MNELWQIWLSGGWVMIPLFGLAALLYAQAFALFLYMRRTNLSGAQVMHWRDWVGAPERAQGRVAEIIRHTQSDAPSDVVDPEQVRNRFDEVRQPIVSLIDQRVAFIAVLVAAAPLLGLLGTVFGMLQTFFGIATGGGAETAGIVASGISEALVTTQTGLTIAVPGLFFVMMIRRQRQSFVSRMARLESLTLMQLHFEAPSIDAIEPSRAA